MDLFDRVKKGDLNYIKTVTEDVILKARDKNGISILSAAIIEDKFDCCKALLKICPSLLYLQDDSDSKYTVLHHATYYGSYVFIDYFLSVGLDAATNEGNTESREENMLRFKKWIKLKNKYADTVLTQATYNHNLHIVKRLIEIDREYKLGLSGIVGRDRRTALQCAVEYQDHDIIKLLTDEGDPYSDYIPYSIAMDLFEHVKKGDLDFVKTVRSDVLLKARDEKGISILSAATIQNKFDCCKEILKKCPSLLYLQEHSNSKFTVLHHATYYDNYAIIDYFLNVGLDATTKEGNMESREGNMLRFKKWVKLKNSGEDTALTQATYFGNLHIVKKLIEVDRECKLGLSEIVGRDRQTALQCAVKNQDHEIIKLLTDEGDPYSDYIPYSIAMDLFDHVKKGDLDYVKTVRSDVLLKSRDEERRSALCIATRFNQYSCCEEILKRCPLLLYHQNNTKDTVLHHATYFRTGFYRLVDLFVGVGLNAATTEGNVESKAENMQHFKNWINLQNCKEDTALTQAAYNRNHDIVKRFLEVDRQYKLGLSEITGFDKKTPLQLALEYEDQEMIKLLTEGTDPDFKYGANADSDKSLWISTTQSDSAEVIPMYSTTIERFYCTRLFYQLASEIPQQYSHAQLKSLMTEVGLDAATNEGNIDQKQYMDLFDRVQKGDLDYIKTVAADVLLNARDEKGISVLSAATIQDQLDCCKEILKKCPSLLYLQEDSESRYTVLHHATYFDSYIFIDFFLSVGLEAATNEGNMEIREENMLRFKKWIKLPNWDADTALSQATYYRNLHIVKRLIEVDREYKLGLSGTVGRDSQTALQLAVDYQDHDIIKLLTDEGDPYSGYIPYSIAMDLFDHIKNGDVDFIKTVTLEVLLNSRDKERMSVLGIATRNDQLDCCQEILKRCPSLLYHQNNSKDTVLHLAAYYGDEIYRLVDFFLGVGLHETTNEGSIGGNGEMMLHFKKWIKLQNESTDTALTLAAYYRHLHIVKRFIEVDREYKLGLSGIPGYKGMTALEWAVENKDHEMIKVLTDEGDPYSDYVPYSIAIDLFDHVKKGDLDYVKTVGSDVLLKSRDEERRSALCIATRYNQFSCCEEILKRCPILLYHQNNNKDTVLHHATYFGYGIYRLVDLFVGVGLEAATIEGNVKSKAENMQRFKNWINLQNRKEDTALTQAVYNRNHNIVKRFLEVDCQYKLGLSEITGFDKKTPLQMALEYEDEEMIKLLTEGTESDFKYGASTDGDKSLWIPTSQSDSAGKDAADDLEKVRHTSLATEWKEDFYGGEFESTDSITRLLNDLAREKPRPYSHALLRKFTKEFSYPIGSGGFGDVYKGEFPNGVPIAVKVLKNSRPKLMQKQFAAEVSTMGRTYHKNLIKLYGYCYEAEMKALIYEYMENGSLDVILKKNNLDMAKLYTIATEIARGISYLHESLYPQIIHHDLKPANVLLDSEFSPRVIDFGLAKLSEKSQFAQTGLRGTRGYVAPEMTQLELGMISYKCDVFSFGMMLFDILKSKINYAGHGWLPGQVWEKFKENKLDSFLKDHGIKEDDKANAKTLSMVALLCAEYIPRNRPYMSTVVKMLEGEITPRPPVNPFPLYDSSSDSSTTNDSRY